jgi:hypothetical protein
MLQPDTFEWDSPSGRDKYSVGNPIGGEAEYPQSDLVARTDCFETCLGPYNTTGDTGSLEQSRRAAELAFRALVRLINDMADA